MMNELLFIVNFLQSTVEEDHTQFYLKKYLTIKNINKDKYGKEEPKKWIYIRMD